MPAQALDHSAGYLIAGAVMSALERRHLAGTIEHIGVSLASIADTLLTADAQSDRPAPDGLAPETSWREATTQIRLPSGGSIRTARPAFTYRGEPLQYRDRELAYGVAEAAWLVR